MRNWFFICVIIGRNYISSNSPTLMAPFLCSVNVVILSIGGKLIPLGKLAPEDGGKRN